ncbi:MAG: hypothetical protein AAF432_09630 [Planctomycetota bacterium]
MKSLVAVAVSTLAKDEGIFYCDRLVLPAKQRACKGPAHDVNHTPGRDERDSV